MMMMGRAPASSLLGLSLLALLLTLTGCGTIADMADHQKIFGGTRYIGERVGEPAVFGPCSSCGPCWLFDLPLTLAADTVCLPVTATLAIIRASKEEPHTKDK
jgi:uncharacterized protein YceK